MPLPSLRRAAPCLVVLAALAQGCARTTSSAEPGAVVTPVATATPARPLPPVPEVDGPLAINVVYPRPNQVVTSRDSNFIFGSIGSGKASLSVNGFPARVYPNGAFIAFVPNPHATDSAQTTATYALVAVKGAETAKITHPIRYPERRLAAVTPVATATPARPLPPVPEVDGPLAINVVYPRPNQVVTSRDSNFIFGSIGSGKASLSVNGFPARVYPNGAFIAFVPNPHATDSAQTTATYALVAVKGAETAKITHPIRYPERRLAAVTSEAAPAKPESLATSRADSLAALHQRVDSLRALLTREEPIGWVQIGVPSAATDTDRTIIGRPVPGGTYKWFFTPGTVVPLMGRENGIARVRLDRDLDAYVDIAEVRDVAADQVPARRTTSNIRVRPSSLGEDVIIPIGPRAPYYVEETDRALVLTLYGVRGNTDIVNYGAGDSLVRAIDWVQETNGRARITVALRHAPYGYLVLWENNSLVLKLRGRPAIDERHPLAGVVIAVDPGHPPIGATGPTGLWEPRATLPISFQLKRILEERGARVVMTRTSDSAVALEARPVIARKANVNAFVSIHLNAYGDGTNPFVAPGTGTYFFRTHSEPLARAVQRGMVEQLGLTDLGVNYDNLAVVRGTWYPAVLCEGAFIILPDQEAALRTPEFQERYARGVADGLESYFRTLPAR